MRHTQQRIQAPQLADGLRRGTESRRRTLLSSGAKQVGSGGGELRWTGIVSSAVNRGTKGNKVRVRVGGEGTQHALIQAVSGTSPGGQSCWDSA